MKERLLSIGDLASGPGKQGRWVYTRSGILKLTYTKDFPPPICIVSQGKVRVWREDHVLQYEKAHPEVLSTELRHRKRRGWAARVRRPFRQLPAAPLMPWSWYAYQGGTGWFRAPNGADDPPGLAPADADGCWGITAPGARGRN